MIFYFGDKKNSFDPALFKHKSEALIYSEPFKTIAIQLNIKHLLFLHQVHSNGGTIITDSEHLNQFKSFTIDGDFLITPIQNIGLAIATADCLPVILYDPVNKIIAAVHAGWQGTMLGVSVSAIVAMQKEFNTNLNNLQIFFGPSAGVCCYEVGEEFTEKIPKKYNDVLIKKNNKWFLNLLQLNRSQLKELGIPERNFNAKQNHCTIENLNYCSYRRDKTSVRQMSVVVLK